MSFQYPATGEKVDALKPECYLRTKTDEFVLKQIDESDDFNTYTATLNVEELESKVFTTGFEMIEKTIRECLENAFAGTGWSIRNCEITKRRTIRETDQQTGWTILQKALSTYRCECIIDTLQKAKELPCVFNNWALFYHGKFETVNLLDVAHLKKILEK